MECFKKYAELLKDDSFLDKEKDAALTIGAASGNPDALWLLSEQKREQNDLVTGKILLFQAAKKNLGAAQEAIGDAYFNGKFKPRNTVSETENTYTFVQDDTAAANWYKQGYENKNLHCTGQLGICYNYGIGVEQNVANAQELLHQAVSKGDLEVFGESYMLDNLIKTSPTPIEKSDIKTDLNHSPVTEKLEKIVSCSELREKIKLQKKALKYIQWTKEADGSYEKLKEITVNKFDDFLLKALFILIPVYWLITIISLLGNYIFHDKFDIISKLLYFTMYIPARIYYSIADLGQEMSFSQETVCEIFRYFLNILVIGAIWFFVSLGIIIIIYIVLFLQSDKRIKLKVQSFLAQIEQNADKAISSETQELDTLLENAERTIRDSISQLPVSPHLKQELYIYPLYEESLHHRHDSFKTLEESFEHRLRVTQREAQQEKNHLPCSEKRRLFKPVPWMADMGREDAIKYFKGAVVKKNIIIALECALNYISTKCPVGGRGDGEHLDHLYFLFESGKSGKIIVTPDLELSTLFRQGAIAVFEKAAERGYSEAMLQLYHIYRWDDKEKSLFWGRKAISDMHPKMLYQAASDPEFFSLSEGKRIEYAIYAYEHGVKEASTVLDLIQISQEQRAKLEKEIREYQRTKYNQEINQRMDDYRKQLDWKERDINQFFSNSYLTNEERSILGEVSDRDYYYQKSVREDMEKRHRRKIEEEMRNK